MWIAEQVRQRRLSVEVSAGELAAACYTARRVCPRIGKLGIRHRRLRRGVQRDAAARDRLREHLQCRHVGASEAQQGWKRGRPCIAQHLPERAFAVAAQEQRGSARVELHRRAAAVHGDALTAPVEDRVSRNPRMAGEQRRVFVHRLPSGRSAQEEPP